MRISAALRESLNPLLSQADEQIVELGRGQPRGILYDGGPFLMKLLTLFTGPTLPSSVRKTQLSIRVNAQWRICFAWRQGGAEDVELVDYH